jgi:hypothetical protein
MARWRRVRRLAAVIPAVVLAAQAVAAPSPAARVDSLFAFAGDSTPGCAVGVYRDGTILFSRGHGMADLENTSGSYRRRRRPICSIRAWSGRRCRRDGRARRRQRPEDPLRPTAALGTRPRVVNRHEGRARDRLVPPGALVPTLPGTPPRAGAPRPMPCSSGRSVRSRRRDRARSVSQPLRWRLR